MNLRHHIRKTTYPMSVVVMGNFGLEKIGQGKEGQEIMRKLAKE